MCCVIARSHLATSDLFFLSVFFSLAVSQVIGVRAIIVCFIYDCACVQVNSGLHLVSYSVEYISCVNSLLTICAHLTKGRHAVFP